MILNGRVCTKELENVGHDRKESKKRKITGNCADTFISYSSSVFFWEKGS